MSVSVFSRRLCLSCISYLLSIDLVCTLLFTLPLPAGLWAQVQCPASGGEGAVVYLVCGAVDRGLEQASLEQGDVGGAGDDGQEDNGVDGVGAGSVGHILEQRSDLAVVAAGLARVLGVVKGPPARRY